jgi:hypothetical protein
VIGLTKFLSKFNFSDDFVFLFLQSNNQQKTIQATKERAKPKCSVCQGFGHTEPKCPQKGAPAGGLPAPIIGSGSRGLQIDVQQPKIPLKNDNKKMTVVMNLGLKSATKTFVDFKKLIKMLILIQMRRMKKNTPM